MKPTPNPASPAHAAPVAGQPAGLPSWWRSPVVLPAILFVLTGVLIGLDSKVALAVVVLEGSLSLGVLLAAGLAGGWLVSLLGLGGESWRDRLMIGAGLGIGFLLTVVLALGSAGLLSRRAAWVLVGILTIAALLRVLIDIRRALLAPTGSESQVQPTDRTTAGAEARGSFPEITRTRREAIALAPFHYLWLLACPFLAIAAMAASTPPGILWAEEARGYDVLEYHLAVPREFLEAGHVFFMPYNVYSNFPLNSEMCSLLMMTLRGGAFEGVFAAQIANVVMAILFVAAAWWAGRMYSSRAGVVAGVLAAMTPWIAYLAGIAFVEAGMLAMGMLSLGAMLRAGGPGKSATRWALAAGLLAGLAAGYKYTAIPLIALPIAVVPLFANVPWRSRFARVAIFGIAATIAFSPWMIRNTINTHNPVFPLGYKILGAKAGVWDDVLNARWQHAHGLAGSGLAHGQSKTKAAWERTVGDWRLGVGLAVLAAIGALRRRDRWTAALLVMLALQFGVWLGATHLFARFAVVLVLPLLLIAARLVEHVRSRLAIDVVVIAIVVGASANLYLLAALYYDHQPVETYGHTNWFLHGDWPTYEYLTTVNELEGKARVMLVGEARTFYVRPPHEYAVVFNHHPLAQAVRRFTQPSAAQARTTTATASAPGLSLARAAGSDGTGRQAASGTVAGQAASGAAAAAGTLDAKAVIRWLRQRGITHVLVNWPEIGRLQATYGLDECLDEALFSRLESAGLSKMGDFSLRDDMPPYATLYEVPNERHR